MGPGRPARIRTLILGAGGRDFHDFNMVFRADPRHEVVAFTAAQIPNIADRRYPPELAGPLYPEGIRIVDEEMLDALLVREGIDEVVFAYSDVTHEHVMHLAARALAHGAGFRLLGPRETMLPARRPVVSVCAVRTGCGKSPAARRIARALRDAGRRVAVVRHPMPYGDLAKQAVQRFASLADLAAAQCTVEEREEYEPHLAQGGLVFAGVDYAAILQRAEAEADVIVWDGGNNDTPFFVPDLEIVLVDPHRAGDERRYFPGEVNLLRADVIVVAKVDTAPGDAVAATRAAVRAANPAARVVDARLPLALDEAERVRGARVLVIEDGPTLTHGGMAWGAGVLAARAAHAGVLVDPRPFAVGGLAETFARHPHIGALLPAMGYGETQLHELGETIRRTPCDVVVVATPVDLASLIDLGHPAARVRYGFEIVPPASLDELLQPILADARGMPAASR